MEGEQEKQSQISQELFTKLPFLTWINKSTISKLTIDVEFIPHAT